MKDFNLKAFMLAIGTVVVVVATIVGINYLIGPSNFTTLILIGAGAMFVWSAYNIIKAELEEAAEKKKK